jgi:light-regulated signal transduction histidine kinase (bacteriophytochrome)
VEFVSNVYQAGATKVIQCNIRDITERKRADVVKERFKEQLEQRVIERTEELEAFSYSVSHDLRAPLRHVMGFVELLQKDKESSLSEKGSRHLNTIFEATTKMDLLIVDLLAFSRIGHAELRKVEVDLDKLVQETLCDFQAETKGRNIIWTMGSLPAVSADRALLRLALVNLISNALKFTSARQEARIEIGSAPDENNETVVFVRDNGAGFDPKYTEKLFGVFQRLHAQSEFPGTGIGLANVRRIIQRHGGRAWAEGAVNVGATFFISIPKREGTLT